MTDQELRRLIDNNQRDVELFVADLRVELQRFAGERLNNSKEDLTTKDYIALLALLLSFKDDPVIADKLSQLVFLYNKQLDFLKANFDINTQDKEDTQDVALLEYDAVTSTIEKSITDSVTSIALTSGVIAGGAYLIQNLSQGIKKDIKSYGASLESNLLGYQSSMQIRKAIDGKKKDERLFRYYGIRDNKNRPFCRFVLDQNRLWSVNEIQELDKRSDILLTPVMIYRGGYNCRHIWSRI